MKYNPENFNMRVITPVEEEGADESFRASSAAAKSQLKL
jgi:hypothetical protein